MSHIVKQIKINCTQPNDILNRNSNCNFQNLNIEMNDDYEIYNIPENYHFYKAIDNKHQNVLEYSNIGNIYRNNPTWLSDLRTAFIYYNTYINQGKKSKSECDIFAFKPTRVLKLFNLLSTNNLKKLYDKIFIDIKDKWNEIIGTYNEDINIILYEELSLLLKYKYTIEATTGYNATFDEQKKYLNATKKYNEHHMITGTNQKIRYKIKNNLHSELNEDLNRISLFKSDSILINILMKYLPQFDGYCSYRTKSLIHYPEFHEEICIFNPEHLLLRAMNNICDANNPKNFKSIKIILVNNDPSFIQEGGMQDEQELLNKIKQNLFDEDKQELLKFEQKLLQNQDGQELLQEQELLNKIKQKLFDEDEQELLIFEQKLLQKQDGQELLNKIKQNLFNEQEQEITNEQELFKQEHKLLISNEQKIFNIHNLIINIYNSLNSEFENYFIKQYEIDDYIFALNTLYNHLLIFKFINLIIQYFNNPIIKENIPILLRKINKLIFLKNIISK
jgi:hypothetical protein